MNFRRGVERSHSDQMIVKFNGIDSRDKARELVGKHITWTAAGKQKKEIKGEIRGPHGNSGAVRVKFLRGMPGQAIGAKVMVN